MSTFVARPPAFVARLPAPYWRVPDAQGVYLPAGDPARRVVRSAFGAVLFAAALFETFAVVTTQVRPLRAHSPWQNDPYDTVVSFTVFFVPLVCGLCLVRVQLFRRGLPLEIFRVRDLLRACAVVLGLIGITLVTDWTGVVLRADRATWTRATLLLAGMLAVTSCAAAAAGIALSWASRQPSLAGRDVPRSSVDWAGDLVAVADRLTRRLGPLGPAAGQVSRWLRTGVLDGRWGARRHPLWWAGGAAVAFGSLLAVAAAREEGFSPVLPLFLSVGACGMFAFLVTGGAFLGIVRGATPSSGGRRRLIDAMVATCASVPVALALRDSLWWIVGSTGDRAGLGQLAMLLTVLGGAVFLVVLAVETALAVHARRVTLSP